MAGLARSQLAEGRRSGEAEATCYRCWEGGIRVGATNHGSRDAEGPKQKPSLVFHWVGSGYTFGRGNLPGGTVEVPLCPSAKISG
uniref:Uncharacterized protein n=1 Tax=Oryza nivara TaxID=4536 RepID=A0A0E0JBV9_ORYNI